MQQEQFIIALLIAVYAFMAFLILYNMEIRWRVFSRFICIFGRHRYQEQRLGELFKSYKCIACGKPKSKVKLTLIEGGKKDLGGTFKW